MAVLEVLRTAHVVIVSSSEEGLGARSKRGSDLVDVPDLLKGHNVTAVPCVLTERGDSGQRTVSETTTADLMSQRGLLVALAVTRGNGVTGVFQAQ